MYPVNAQLVSLWIKERQDEAREQRLAHSLAHRSSAGASAIVGRLLGSRRRQPAACSC